MKLKNAIISRLKIMAELDIAERRLPQDGRIKLKLGKGREMDFRVSVCPTLFGEKVVLRLLDKSNLQLDMTKLGFDPDPLKDFKDAIDQPYGMVLVTGPTGSGKTTTLYSALSELNKTTDNISTAEDPVEFNFSGINQVQMHEDIGLNFAAALRCFLRQDPDIIMVGEIRDFETAEIAVKAALTGHLVLSTLHTNDAPGDHLPPPQHGRRAVPRHQLGEPGPGPAPRAQALPGVQEAGGRAGRRRSLDIGVQPDESRHLPGLRAGGCRTCNDRGYKGRVALYEVMPMCDSLKELVLNGASTAELKAEAIRLGMQTLRMAGIAKLKVGHDQHRRSGRQHGSGYDAVTREPTLAQSASAAQGDGREGGRATSTSPPARRRSCASTASLVPLKTAAAHAGRDQAALLLDPHRRAEAQVRGGERARPLLRREEPLALPRQHLHAARRRGGRLPHHPLQDPHLRGAGPAAGRRGARRRSRAAWCWSPGPPARARSPRSRRSSTRSTPSAHEHIITIEDPIEYLHPHKNCVVNQREVGADTHSFKKALKYILRQDPDVVLVGEMRDLETIEAALTIAETGHLVFATLHTNSCVQTINRIIDVFPPYQQPQIRAQLSFVLEGVVTQKLIAKASGPGRVLAIEVMVPEPRHPEPDPRGQGPPDLLADAGRPGEVRHADVEPVARVADPARA